MKHSHPNPTGYGWLIRTDSGELVETASDAEANELNDDEEE